MIAVVMIPAIIWLDVREDARQPIAQKNAPEIHRKRKVLKTSLHRIGNLPSTNRSRHQGFSCSDTLFFSKYLHRDEREHEDKEK